MHSITLSITKKVLKVCTDVDEIISVNLMA